ncbi:MAG: hypothetical protein AAF573_02245 [Bacteroidota bacterium]
MTSTIVLISRIIQYNLKIIFAGRFFLFLLAAIGFYIFSMVMSTLNDAEPSIILLYEITFLPAFLLTFYPVVFGIQKDDDARMLEILFGIPNYRYKVWLIRLTMIFLLVFILLILFSSIGSYLIYPTNPVRLASQLLYPVCFLGSLAFLLATRIKNGNATAVVIVILVFFLIITSEMLEHTQWDIFLNPFKSPRQYTQIAFQEIIWKNRVFLSVGTIVFTLGALLNLQNRERYI